MPSDSPCLPPERRLTLFALISLIFFTTSGGAFGLEPLVGAVGPGWAVLLMLLTPLVWSLPMALMVAELASLMPEEGGYYVWVRETIGPFWAVQEAWWSMAYSTVLLAIFPVLFVSYLSYFIPVIAPGADFQHPVLGPLLRWFIAVLLIASATFLNLRGARDVGISAKFSATIVCGAFAALVLTWITAHPNPATTLHLLTNDLRNSHRDAVLLGISLIVLNYSGWDNASTMPMKSSSRSAITRVPSSSPSYSLLSVMSYQFSLASASLPILHFGAPTLVGLRFPD
jgi:amino acid transporter